MRSVVHGKVDSSFVYKGVPYSHVVRLAVAEPEASHLPGKLNDLSDYLSRLSAPVVPPKPTGLGDLKVRTLAEKDVLRFVLPSAAERPDLWVARPDNEEPE